MLKSSKRIQTPQRFKGRSNQLDNKIKKSGRSEQSGKTIEGVLTKLAGTNFSHVRDYQDHTLVMTPGSPWDANTP